MDIVYFIIIISLIHFVFFFFNTIFVSCMHLPYLTLLKNLGIEIELLRIKWFTTAFNRILMKWGIRRSRFWSLWFNTGQILTILLLPIAAIVILKMTFDNCYESSQSSTDKNQPVLKIMIPGIDIPLNEMAYYVFSMILSSAVHEVGHAMAAVREGVRFFGMGVIVFFIVPVAFVQINDDQLNLLPMKSRLQILCAGIWHNIVLSGFAITLVGIITLMFSPFFLKNSGIYVKQISSGSGVLGPSGLVTGDVVHRINDCSVKNSTDWSNCILQSIQLPSPGYCVTDNIIKKLDKSFLSEGNRTYSKNCCDEHNNNNGYLCYEQSDGFNVQSHSISTHFCLPTRAIVESSHNFCQNNDQCIMLSDSCVRPVLDNATKIVQIQRYGRKDVIFHGHPAEVYYTTQISDWVPRFFILSPSIPEAIILLSKYVASFSAGMAIINIVPCFYFDGKHIATLLIDGIFEKKAKHGTRALVSLIIVSVFTFLLIFNVLKMYMSKMY